MCTDRLSFGFLALSVAVLAATAAFAGDPSLVVTASSHAVTVGDRVPVTVQARGEGSWLWGELTVKVAADGPWVVVEGPNEILGARPPAWQVTLAPMATGSIPLPEVATTARLPDGDPQVVTAVEASTVEVASVLPPDAEVEPAPLRDPVGVHGLPWEWAVPILIVVIPALVIQHWWLRRRRAASVEGEDAALPPFEQLEQLARDLGRDLRAESAGVVCDRLAAGFRRYLERRTGEPACEMTSFELRVVARRQGWPEAVQRGLHRVMQVVDGVRFGRRAVAQDELQQTVSTAVETARGLESHLEPAVDELEAVS